MTTKEFADLRQQLLPVFEDALAFAGEQAQRIVNAYPGYHPMYTVEGRWQREGELWTHWCEGFFPGILWLLFDYTGEEKWRKVAEEFTRRLEPRKLDRNVHDLGFIFGSTYLRWYRLTNDPALRDVLIQAGRTLALRRQKGGYLASFIGPQSLFIDIMMNVPLIWWAANETGDENLRKVALEHCRTTAKYLVRADGGTAHEGIFDVQTGEFERQSTHQGWQAESAWARGQAWSLYGFTTVSQLAGAESAEFLHSARKCADFWLARVPAGKVPLWDLDVHDDGQQPYDSSAAAIAASGLWDLSEIVENEEDRARYRHMSLKTLETLCSDEFLAQHQPGWEGILRHGVYHKHKGLGVDESVAWGEYFFVEALLKAVKGQSVTGWTT